MKRFLSIFGAGALAASVSAAQGLPDNIARVEVLPGWRDATGVHYAAIAIDLAPGWKTYWRRPGEGGIPPVFDWRGSDNLANARVSFPVPKVFVQNGIQSIGYETTVVFPVAARAAIADADISLRGTLLIGVCEEICVPLDIEISADLQAANTGPVDRVQAAMADRPMTAKEADVMGVACRIEPIRDGLRVDAIIDMPPIADVEAAVVEMPDELIWVSDAQLSRRGSQLTAQVEMVPPENAPFALARNDVRITIFGNGRAVEIQGCG